MIADNLHYRRARRLFLTRLPDRLITVARTVARRVPLPTKFGAESFVRTMGDQFWLRASQPRRLIVVVALATANWPLDAAALSVPPAAFGYPRPFGCCSRSAC